MPATFPQQLSTRPKSCRRRKLFTPSKLAEPLLSLEEEQEEAARPLSPPFPYRKATSTASLLSSTSTSRASLLSSTSTSSTASLMSTPFVLLARGPLLGSRKGAASPREGPSSSRKGKASLKDGPSISREEISSLRKGVSSSKEETECSREDLSCSREGLSSSQEGFSSYREGLSSSREDLSCSREGLFRSREGLSSSREGFSNSREGLSSSREDLKRSREGPSSCREDLSCQVCGNAFIKSLSQLETHVAGHFRLQLNRACLGLYRGRHCNLCGWEAKTSFQLITHIGCKHGRINAILQENSFSPLPPCPLKRPELC